MAQGVSRRASHLAMLSSICERSVVSRSLFDCGVLFRVALIEPFSPFDVPLPCASFVIATFARKLHASALAWTWLGSFSKTDMTYILQEERVISHLPILSRDGT